MKSENFFSMVRDIFSTPTAPFYEQMVAEKIQSYLEGYDNLTAQYDEYGNLIVKYIPPNPCKNAPLVAVAHMDHPGFEITEVRSGITVARMHGYIAPEYLRGAHVVIEGKSGPIRANITDIELDESEPPADLPEDPQTVLWGSKRARRVKSVILSVAEGVEPGSFARLDFEGYEETGELIRTRAADDLAGCSVILATLIALAEQKVQTNFWGVFTRAEEVGFAGAIGLVESGHLPKEASVISVEASSIRAGAKPGAGPVIRLGDRMSIFDFVLTNHLRTAGASVKKRNDMFTCQQMVMDKGTCEASVFSANGFVSGGIAIPLGNYHNMADTELDPHLRPEFVHKADLWWSFELLKEAAVLAPKMDRSFDSHKRRLTYRAEEYLKKLRENN